MELNLSFDSVVGRDNDSPRVFLAHALKPDQLQTRRIWAGVGPGTELPSQTGPEPDVASPSRTEREPTKPMLDVPGSELVPLWRGPEPDRTSPSRTEREPYTLRTGAGTGPTTELSDWARAGPEQDLRPYQCWSDVLGLPPGRRQPARTRDSVPAVLPDGPGLGWIHNEPSRGGRVRRPCPCR